MAKVVAHVDPGKGKVYRVPFGSMEQARAFVRGPHSRGSRVVIVGPSSVESYERGNGSLKQRLVSRERTRRAKVKAARQR